jgi:hypothetical protein
MNNPRKPRQPEGGPRKGSQNAWLASFEVGERRYVETNYETRLADMSHCVPHKHRRANGMENMDFSVKLLTAVGHSGDIRYLICVERKN